jgi:hypothetical protein
VNIGLGQTPFMLGIVLTLLNGVSGYAKEG